MLVVDDNRDGGDAMKVLVTTLGGEARIAYDGESGLRVLEEFEPQVILLDIGMPGMDGYETCRRIRQRWEKEVAVVALTGWGQAQDKRLAAEAGFDAHLTKPADPARLEELLKALAVH